MLYAPSSSGNTPRALTYAAADAVAALQIGDDVTAVLLEFKAVLFDEMTQASDPQPYEPSFKMVSTMAFAALSDYLAGDTTRLVRIKGIVAAAISCLP